MTPKVTLMTIGECQYLVGLGESKYISYAKVTLRTLSKLSLLC